METNASREAPAPHRIEGGDGDAAGQDRQDTNEDIHELRKFIMDMMHTEMEFVERIKQNEDSIATVNGRIEEFKSSVKMEQGRTNAIEARVQSSMQELRALEDKKIVLDAKYRQFQDVVSTHELNSISLKNQHQRLRGQIRMSEEHVKGNELRITSFTSSSEKLRSRYLLVIEEMDCRDQIDMTRSELQKVRAKRRYIDQHTEQLEGDLRDTEIAHDRLKEELEIARVGLSQQNAALGALDRDCSRRRTQLLEEVHQSRLHHEQSNKKLKAKQKKYRSKMRAEIVTLRKRVAFLTKELENHEMSAEDILSSIAPFRDQRYQLEAMKVALEAEVADYEERIGHMQQEIEEFDSCKEKFDIRDMKAQLAEKNNEVDLAVRALKAKQDELCQLQRDDQKLQEELENLDSQIEEASVGGIDRKLETLAKAREELQAQHDSLVEEERIAKDQCQRLSDTTQGQQRWLKRLKAATSKMQKDLRKKSAQRNQSAENLEEQERLLSAFDEVDQCTTRFEEEFDVIQVAQAEELERLERDLNVKEQEWQRRCLEEETRLKTELDDWSAKVEELEVQLRAR